MRQHGWFRPHVRGLTAISSTTLREGGGWWIPGSQLDLDFANDRSFNRKTGYNATPNGLLTYTSPSPKMVYGADGVLRYARHNLLTYSEQFDNAAWTKVNVTISGSTIQCGSGGTVHRISQAITPVSVRSRVYYDVKAGTYPYVQILDGASANNYATFDLSTGTIGAYGSNTTASITDLGDGYYRCSVEFGAANPPDNTTYLGFAATAGAGYASSFSALGTETIIAARGQLQLLPCSETTYIGPTTSAARYSLPIDHDPLTGEALGVLIEGQRTNLLLQSQDFSTSWTTGNVTVTVNTTTAPDGTTTADKIAAATSAATTVYQASAVAATAATFSVYAKLGSGATEANKFLVYNVTTASNLLAVSFNYSTGGITYTTGSSGASAVELGDGWWRLILSASSGITSGNTIRVYSCFAGASETAGEYAYLWGAQLEAGAFATSYIPTAAAQVTRAADQVSLATSAFNFSATEGTLSFEAETAFSGSYVYEISDGSTSERIIGVIGNNNHLYVVDGSVVQAAIDAGTIAVNTMTKAAQAFSVNDFAAVISGGSVGTDVSGTLPTVTSLRVGSQVGGTNNINGHIKRLTYFSTRKTNAELQVLSA